MEGADPGGGRRGNPPAGPRNPPLGPATALGGAGHEKSVGGGCGQPNRSPASVNVKELAAMVSSTTVSEVRWSYSRSSWR